MQHLQYIIGCLATCDVNIPPKNGSCSGTAGAGCCQVDLPKGVRVYQGFFNSLYNTTAIWRNTPCNYITVMERAAFSFSTTYLTSPVFYDRDDSRSPVVMEWGITQKTCEAAKSDKTVPYACVSNYSECITNEAGYLCKCAAPGDSKAIHTSQADAQVPLQLHYYSFIIQLLFFYFKCSRRDFTKHFGVVSDIDECQDNVTYPYPGICKNTVGGYNCSCSPGKSLINGVCIKKQKSIWMALVVGRFRGSLHALVFFFYVPCVHL